MQGTGIAIHPTNLPLDLLHSANLPKPARSFFATREISYQLTFVVMELIFTLGQINEAARQFWQQAGSSRVFAFHAPMGTGKTTFIAALCRELGVSAPCASPSFALVNEYPLPSGESVYHADLYRIDSEAEAREAGIEELLNSGAICLVEWPERAPGILPEDTLHLTMGIEPYSGKEGTEGMRYLRTFTEAS
jgi:tRNA threonylcarbamoyladenosine biosynthesis protein TsaE